MWSCIVSTVLPIHCCLKWVSTLTSSKSFSSFALFFVFYINWYKCTILSCPPRSLLRHLILSILCHPPPYRITPSLVLLEYGFPLTAPLASEVIKIKPFTNLGAPYQVKHFLSFEFLAHAAFQNLWQLVSSSIHASCSFTRVHFLGWDAYIGLLLVICLTQVINNIFKWTGAFYLHEFYNETESVTLWQK